MALASRLEHRIDQRDHRFNGGFSLRLIPNDNEGKIVPVRPIDVSKRGLGFLVREQLRSGGFYFLMIGKVRFRVEIAYCDTHLGIDNLFRCGLFLREAEGDLQGACQVAGLLADGHKSNGL